MVLHARELDKSAHEAKQMTTAQAVGAVSREAAEWYAIRLADHQPQRSPTASAYRARNEGKQMGQGASPATFADPLLQRQSSRRSTSDGKQWQENPGCGPRNLGYTRDENTGSTCPEA